MSVRIAQGQAAPPTSGWPTTCGQGPSASATWGIGTPVNASVMIPCGGMSTAIIEALKATAGSTVSGGVWWFEGSLNGADWVQLCYVETVFGGNANNPPASVAGGLSAGGSSCPIVLIVNIAGFNFFRVRLNSAYSGGAGGIMVAVQASSADSGINTYAGNLPGSQNVSLSTSIIAGTVIGNNQNLISGQVSAIANGTTVRATSILIGPQYNTLCFLISITGAGAVTGTLQIFLQDSFDGGTTWQDIVADATFAFGAATRKKMYIVNGRANYGLAVTNSAVTVGTQGAAPAQNGQSASSARQGPFGSYLQVTEVISGVAGSPTGATYSVDLAYHL